MTNEEVKEVLELSKRKDSLLNQIVDFDSYLEDDNPIIDLVMGNSCLSKYIKVTDPKGFLEFMRNDILEEIKDINSKIGFATSVNRKEAEILYTKRESLLSDLDIIDDFYDDDDVVVSLGIGNDLVDKFIYINDPKSVLKVVRNSLLIEINEINKQIDKL